MLKQYQVLFLILLSYITVIAFYPVITAGFINLDDCVMVTDNPDITSLSFSNIKNIFSSFHYKLYHPLVSVSYAIEYYFCRLDPYLYHIDNILLHLFNTLLVFFIFRRLSKSFFVSYIVAILFAIHPVHVEAVAWISSRKDTLYSLFYLLSILFYIKIDDNKYYKTLIFASAVSFFAACLCKPTAVTLPAVLILIDFYRGKLTINRLKQYIPFFIISAVFIYLAIHSHYSPEEKAIMTLFVRAVNILNAHFNILFYIYKFIAPVNLSCLYPHFYNHYSLIPAFILYSPTLLYLMLFAVCLTLKYDRKIFFGFLFFLITLLPSSGILPTGVAPVADRYAYLPYIGLFYLFAELLFFIYKKYSDIKYILIFFIVCIMSGLFYLTYTRNMLWTDNEKLMTQAINLFPETADHAYLMRGTLYKAGKQLDKAEDDLEKSYSINKQNAYTVFHLGHLNQLQGNNKEAKKYYSYIPENSVNYISVINNIGIILEGSGKRKKAIKLMQDTINKKEFYINDYFYYTLAIFYLEEKDTEKALANFKQALAENPYNYEYYLAVMSICHDKKDFINFEKTAYDGLQNTDNNFKILNFLGKEYFSRSEYNKAEKVFLLSVAVSPNNHTGYFFLGNIAALKKEYRKAVVYYTMAILLSGVNGEYFYKRSAVYLITDKYELSKRDMINSLNKGFFIEEEFKKEIEELKEKEKK